jgi:hypothetical protein
MSGSENRQKNGPIAESNNPQSAIRNPQSAILSPQTSILKPLLDVYLTSRAAESGFIVTAVGGDGSAIGGCGVFEILILTSSPPKPDGCK